jgi:hypothetical protein
MKLLQIEQCPVRACSLLEQFTLAYNGKTFFYDKYEDAVKMARFLGYKLDLIKTVDLV